MKHLKLLRGLFGKVLATSNEQPRVRDGIPFWVWKEHAEILTLILSHIWNLSLRTQTYLAYVMEKIEYKSDTQG